MEFYGEQLIGVITPFVAVSAFLIPLLSLVIKGKRFYNVYASIVSFIVLVMSTLVFLDVYYRKEPIVYAFGGWPPPIGIAYEVDMFNGLLGAYAAFSLFIVVLYSVWYSRFLDDNVWYYTLLLGLEAGVLGCLYTGDVFNLFVMLEVLSISAYALVAYHRNRPEAVEAAIKYAIIGALVTTCYFISLVFIYSSYGTLNMGDLAYKSITGFSPMYIPTSSNGVYGDIVFASLIALALALWAFTFKSALFPNHFWLPDAHPEAPTPVSAALSGLVVNIGVYAVARLLYTLFGLNSIIAGNGYRDAILYVLIILGILSGVVGALLMIIQSDVKRFLAYSTISHIGLIYIGLGIGLSSVSKEIALLGLTATLYHIINHGIGKALLFLASGVYIESTGTRDLGRMAGVGKAYPITSIAFLLGILHLMGFIPFGGFFSKLLIYQAHLGAGLYASAVSVIIISAISLIGYVKLIYVLLLRSPHRAYKACVPKAIEVLLLLMGVLCLLLGLFSFKILNIFGEAVNQGLIEAYRFYVKPVLG